MDVTPRERFDAVLAHALAQAPSPEEGLFGPRSMVWKINREGVVMLGGGCAALLQTAHPFVAQAVADHSVALSDARRRFQRTFYSVFAIVFGRLDKVERAGRMVRTIHEQVRGALNEDVGRYRKGDPYDANSESAQIWVAATLLHTAVQIYERVLRPLTAAEKNTLMAEHKRFCAIFGIRPEAIPNTWAGFERYFADMVESDALAIGTPGQRIAHAIMSPPTLYSVPFYRWLHTFTAGLLSARFRHGYGLAWGPAERGLFAATIPAMWAGVRAAPPHARFFPAYLDARRRLLGRTGPDPVGRLASRVFLATALPKPSRFAHIARRLV